MFCASVSGYRYICSKCITSREVCILKGEVFIFVPMLCSLVLVVNVMHFFKHITLVPLLDFISLMQFPCVVVSSECWTCK